MSEAGSSSLRIMRGWFANEEIDVVAVDADDTLWQDGIYFRRLRHVLLEIACARGVAEEKCCMVLSEESKRQLPGERGYAKSVLGAAERMRFGPDEIRSLRNAVDEFLCHPVEILPFARETLRRMQRFRLVLLTKGRDEEQQRKLRDSDLKDMFESVLIVKKKHSEQFSRILRSMGTSGDRSLVIGNSVVHDIIPAIENSGRGIWLNHPENQHGRNAPLPEGVCEVHGWDVIYHALQAQSV